MNGPKWAVVAGAVSAIGIGLICSPPTGDAQVPPTGDAQVNVQLPATGDAQVRYQETYGWCQQRFPYRTDLQEACRWGAYEMLPGPESQPGIPLVPTYQKGSKNA